jgi:hypothetical protein
MLQVSYVPHRTVLSELDNAVNFIHPVEGLSVSQRIASSLCKAVVLSMEK